MSRTMIAFLAVAFLYFAVAQYPKFRASIKIIFNREAPHAD